MQTLQIREVGQIKEIKKSIAKIIGLTRCMIGQLLEITQNCKGIIMGFSQGEVIVFLLGRIDDARVGLDVYSNMQPFTIPVGEGFLGRIVNVLAEPVDGRGPITEFQKPSFGPYAKYVQKGDEPLRSDSGPKTYYPVFRKAPGVLERIPLEDTLQTGNLLIDSTIPIGKGQRELIIGDRMTGKTTIGVDTILNQKGKNVFCIYCCIGKSYAAIQKVVETLRVHEALEYTIIVQAHAASSGGEQYLVPYTACALGEYFMDRGKDVFVVFDDLTKHAWAYRQLSLLLERPPGRNAYPGDIFYVHSQLMERAGRYSPEFQGGSMTFFPIVDTIEGDITGYIPSSLVSMTDGQIYLDTGLFNSGMRPAVNLGLSISRIGNKVQCPAMKELSKTLRLDYLRHNELLKITKFKGSVSADITERLREGEIITVLFNQENAKPYPLEKQILLLYALSRKVLSALPEAEVEHFKENIFQLAKSRIPLVMRDLSQGKKFTQVMKEALDECFVSFFRTKDDFVDKWRVEDSQEKE